MTLFPVPPEGFEFAEVESDEGAMTPERIRYRDVETGATLSLAEMIKHDLIDAPDDDEDDAV